IEQKEYYLGKATKDNFDLRIIQLTDLHLNSVNAQLKKLAATINQLKPNVLVITGDSVDKAGKLYLLDQFLKLIDKNIPKVAILGNWEYWGQVNTIDLMGIYSNHNCELLINNSLQWVFGNKTISFTGLDDLIGGNADIEQALKNYKESDYHIVLNHCPAYTETIVKHIEGKHKVDFILSGHTHGGQFNLFGFAPFLPRGCGRFISGWYREGETALYVSKGIGTSVIPARFMSRAEFTVFHLKH
ncbi:MAG: metallophosphoesterase, partial [Bacteroidia bacterium]|nr:metallophosphoesterase [Bacteroidia bacterium]